MKIWLVRHGQTVLNAQDRLRGWMDPALTQLGIEQAVQAAEQLPRGLPIYTSDLTRARQTAERLGGQPAATAALRPWNVGILAGLPSEVVHPKLMALQANGLRAPFGETYAEFTSRFESFLATLREPSVLVTHFRNVAYLLGVEAASQTGRVAEFELDR